jgi:hypothetical protein
MNDRFMTSLIPVRSYGFSRTSKLSQPPRFGKLFFGIASAQRPPLEEFRNNKRLGGFARNIDLMREFGIMKIASSLCLVTLAAMLSACGGTTGDRAVSGAGLGAASGAVVGAATGGNAGTGALIGGAVGGIGGAATSPSQVDLGKPIWR